MMTSWRVVGAEVWAVAVSVTAQWLAWQAGQDTVKTAGEQPGGMTAVTYGALGAVLAAAMPSVLLMVRRRDPVARVWVWAAAGSLVLGTARFVPIPDHELYLSVLAGLAVLGALVVRHRQPAEYRTVPAAVVAGAGLLLPWLWVGALGGPVETALAVVAAGAVGWLAAAVLAPAYPGNGLVLGVGLILIAAGVGQPGPSLAVSALALAGFAVARMRGRVAVGVVTGLGVLGPLAFVGPEEVSVMLAGRDVPIWTAIAGVATAVIAVMVGMVLRFRTPGWRSATFAPATAAFAVAGTFLVASAGNGGPGCATVDLPPGPYPDVVTVGATDHAGAVSAFSGRGPGAKPDLVAPGARIRSALPGGGYGEMSGTSMATPHVAGVVALMWSAVPALIGDLPRTRALLSSTATPVTGPAAGCDAAGAGLVNALAAVQAALGLGLEAKPG